MQLRVSAFVAKMVVRELTMTLPDPDRTEHMSKNSCRATLRLADCGEKWWTRARRTGGVAACSAVKHCCRVVAVKRAEMRPTGQRGCLGSDRVGRWRRIAAEEASSAAARQPTTWLTVGVRGDVRCRQGVCEFEDQTSGCSPLECAGRREEVRFRVRIDGRKVRASPADAPRCSNGWRSRRRWYARRRSAADPDYLERWSLQAR